MEDRFRFHCWALPRLSPSKYGQKYINGLVKNSKTQVYVSRGVGMIGIPVRFSCPPEIAILTLKKKDVSFQI